MIVIRRISFGLILLFTNLIPHSSASSSFTWVNPLPFGTTIMDMWGTDAENVYFCGLSGEVWHFDGDQFALEETGDHPQVIWTGISGINENNIMVVGGSGQVLRWDGATWHFMQMPGTVAFVEAVWVSPQGTYYVVSDKGWVWTYRDDQWQRHQIDYFHWLYAVWGTSDDNVFVAGYAHPFRQCVYHWNGTEWSQVGDTMGWAVQSIWGFNNNDVWVAGLEGMIFRWDGVNWNFHDPGGGLFTLFDIWGVNSDELFMAGVFGLVRHFKSGIWTEEYIDGPDSRRAITNLLGFTNSEILASGSNGLFYKFNGNNWQNLQTGPLDDFNGICTWNDKILVVGDEGKCAVFSDDYWGYQNTGTTSDLNDIWAFDNSVIAVGNSGTILEFDGNEWTSCESNVTDDILGVTGLENGIAYCVGENGKLLKRVEGSWIVLDTGFNGLRFTGVWAESETSVFIAAGNVDNQGTLIHFNGAEGSMHKVPLNLSVNDVYGFSSDDVWAVGDNSSIFHWDGETWSTAYQFDYPWDELKRICGSSNKDMYAVSFPGTIIHYDGIEWSVVMSCGNTINDVCTGKEKFYFAGDGGAILTAELGANQCMQTGVSIAMPSDQFAPGDECSCSIAVCNDSNTPISGFPLFVILDVYGSLYYAPSFDGVDYYNQVFQPGETAVTVLEAFNWPAGVGSAEGIFWYAALTNPEITEIVGGWDSWQFRWSD